MAVATTATSNGGDILWIVEKKSSACPHRSMISQWDCFSTGPPLLASCEAPQGQKEKSGLEGGASKGVVQP